MHSSTRANGLSVATGVGLGLIAFVTFRGGHFTAPAARPENPPSASSPTVPRTGVPPTMAEAVGDVDESSSLPPSGAATENSPITPASEAATARPQSGSNDRPKGSTILQAGDEDSPLPGARPALEAVLEVLKKRDLHGLEAAYNWEKLLEPSASDKQKHTPEEDARRRKEFMSPMLTLLEEVDLSQAEITIANGEHAQFCDRANYSVLVRNARTCETYKCQFRFAWHAEKRAWLLER